MSDSTKRQVKGSGASRSAQATVHELHQSRGRARRQIDRPLAFPNARTIVENAARSAVATDSNNNITDWNPLATEVLGYWPALIPKDRVRPVTAVEVVR